MTKPTPILVAPVRPLHTLSQVEREVLSRVMFQCIRGLDEQHDKRWRRMWNRFFKAEAGEVQHLQTVVERSGPYHRMHMAMEQALFNSQERWTNMDRMRDWLKVGAGWGRYETNHNGQMRFIPGSTSYDKCSDDEMRELHMGMLEFLRTPRAQGKLWPHLRPAARAEMLEVILQRPEVEPC